MTKFDPKRGSTRTDAGNLGEATYFTPKEYIAKAYANNNSAGVYKVKVEIQNPLKIVYDENYVNNIMKEANKLGVTAKPEWRGTTQLNKIWSEEFSRKAKEKGYDAVIAYTDNKFNDIVETAIFDASKVKPEK